jgi:hypothetical protein
VRLVAAAYVGLMACGLVLLPGHVQLADLVFPALLLLVVPAARWRIRPLDLFLLLFLVGSVLSVPGSLAPRQSVLDVLKEAYLFAAYLVLAQVMARAGVLNIMRWLPASAAVTSALSLLAALVFVIAGSIWTIFGQPMPLPYVGTAFRLTGTLETPEFFGNLLTVAVPFAIVYRAQAADRRPWTAALFVMAAAEALTFSKSVAGFAVAATVLLWQDWQGHRRALSFRIVSVAVATLFVLGFNLAATVTVRNVELSFGNDSTIPPPSYLYARQEAAGADTVQVRIAYNPMSYYLVKKAEWVAWRRHPILGIGLGTFHLEAERAYQEGRLTQAYRRIAAHSTVFGRLAETGLVGLTTLAIAWFGIWRCTLVATRTSASHRKIAWACLAGFSGLLINGINVDVMHFRFLWLGLAAVRALDSRTSEPAAA